MTELLTYVVPLVYHRRNHHCLDKCTRKSPVLNITIVMISSHAPALPFSLMNNSDFSTQKTFFSSFFSKGTWVAEWMCVAFVHRPKGSCCKWKMRVLCFWDWRHRSQLIHCFLNEVYHLFQHLAEQWLDSSALLVWFIHVRLDVSYSTSHAHPEINHQKI